MSNKLMKDLFPGMSPVLKAKEKAERKIDIAKIYQGFYNPFRVYSDNIKFLSPSEYYKSLSLASNAIAAM